MAIIKIEARHEHHQPMNIDGNDFMPGDIGTVRINVGKLPSDTRISVTAHIYRSKKPGPTVLLLGGVHGDEINGIEIVREMVDSTLLDNLKRGTVIAIPLLNIYGFINFSREVPDGKDVNRSFPGNSRGSLASRVARTLTRKILPYVDVAIDFHTGGGSRYNYPQVRYTKTDKKAEKLARIFGAPFLLQKPLITKSFRKVARLQNIPAIVFEGGESVRLDGFVISKGLKGAKRVLLSMRMIDSFADFEDKIILFKKSTWLRAPYSGIFIWNRASGVKVQKGEPLGLIKDPYGTKTVKVIANRDGYIVGHNNASVVNQGDALFHIGLDYEILT